MGQGRRRSLRSLCGCQRLHQVCVVASVVYVSFSRGGLTKIRTRGVEVAIISRKCDVRSSTHERFSNNASTGAFLQEHRSPPPPKDVRSMKLNWCSKHTRPTDVAPSLFLPSGFSPFHELRNRCFRLLGSSKFGKSAALRVAATNQRALEHMVWRGKDGVLPRVASPQPRGVARTLLVS